MESYHAHQLILPTDKRNPCFTLYATEDQQSIRVFYGLELMEVVPDDPDQMAFKMLAGRLYNAGVLVAKLEEVFKADRKTIRSWGDAIVSRDPERLARVLLGRGVNQKRTPAIDHYVARRWDELLAEGCPNHRATLMREIQSIFEVKFSGETLRQIILELKASRAALPGNPPHLTALPPWCPSEEITCSQNPITTTDDLAVIIPESSPQADCSALAPIEGEPTPSKCSPLNWQPRPGEAVLCDHVGMLIFAGALSSIAQATSPPEPLLAQWLGSVLLGAVNIEQTKYLNWQDLGDLFGQTVRFPTPQREQLTRLATPATIDAVLRWNYQQLAIPGDDNDLYYDPHTTHYTGTQNILKGWCAAIRWADKLINSDYIHTAQGHPIYFECTDNFDDLRGRFFPLIGRLRTSLQWSQERILTLIVDRGIYSNDIFNQILADPNIHLITWEKGYQSEKDTPWETLATTHRAAGTYGFHTFSRLRNNSRDHRPYHFEYIHRPWTKNPAIRQIIVRATNPNGRTVQLSILTDDTQRPVYETVRLMFNRWIQENNFKYLNKHFGINSINSSSTTRRRNPPWKNKSRALTNSSTRKWCAWTSATKPSWTPSRSPPGICSIGFLRPSRPPTTITATITTTTANSPNATASCAGREVRSKSTSCRKSTTRPNSAKSLPRSSTNSIPAASPYPMAAAAPCGFALPARNKSACASTTSREISKTIQPSKTRHFGGTELARPFVQFEVI